MNARAQLILRIDGGAALCAGLATLALHVWLARLHGFAAQLVLLIGLVNVLYAVYSGTLAWRAARGHAPRRVAVDCLVLGNLTWTAVCAGIVFCQWRTANWPGLAHVALEGLFVAALALLELRFVRPHTR